MRNSTPSAQEFFLLEQEADGKRYAVKRLAGCLAHGFVSFLSTSGFLSDFFSSLASRRSTFFTSSAGGRSRPGSASISSMAGRLPRSSSGRGSVSWVCHAATAMDWSSPRRAYSATSLFFFRQSRRPMVGEFWIEGGQVFYHERHEIHEKGHGGTGFIFPVSFDPVFSFCPGEFFGLSIPASLRSPRWATPRA